MTLYGHTQIPPQEGYHAHHPLKQQQQTTTTTLYNVWVVQVVGQTVIKKGDSVVGIIIMLLLYLTPQ
jgi:hypothetical protein